MSDEVPETAESRAIDALLAHFADRAGASDASPIGGTVHLHCSDAAGEWMVRAVDGRPVVTREHAKGDVAARGAAADILLVLQGRQPAASLDVIGDVAVFDRFLEVVRDRLGPG